MHNPASLRSSLKLAFTVTALMFLAILPVACQGSTPAQVPQETPGKPAATGRAPGAQQRATPAPLARDFVLASSYTGEVKTMNRVDLTAKVGGRVREIKADVGDRVKKGDLLAVLEHDVLDIQVKQAEAALALAKVNLAKLEEGPRKEQVAVAEAALKGAQAQLDALLAGATKEQIAAARANLDGAQAQLDSLVAGATPEQIRISASQVRDAEEKLRSVDLETARTLQITRIVDVEGLNYALATRESQLAQQQAKIQIARDQLDSLKAAPTPSAIARLKATVDAAKASLDALLAPPKAQDVTRLEAAVAAAREQLELARTPFRSNDFEIARIGVQQAQSALELAKTNRDEAFLYAPFDGTILARIASEGALASANSPLLTILSGEVQVSIAIEEAAVGKVRPDQVWDVRVLAYPDRVFKGKVRAVSPALNPATRTFDVLLAPQEAAELLLPGMFITASLPQ